jgi:hypothetical protein
MSLHLQIGEGTDTGHEAKSAAHHAQRGIACGSFAYLVREHSYAAHGRCAVLVGAAHCETNPRFM